MVRFDGIHLALCLALIRVVAWEITTQSHVSGRTNPVDMGDAGRTAALNGAEASQCSEDDVLRQLAKHRVQALELFARHDDDMGESLNHIASHTVTAPKQVTASHTSRGHTIVRRNCGDSCCRPSGSNRVDARAARASCSCGGRALL